MTLKGPYRRRDAVITPASNTRSVAVEAERHWWVSKLEMLIGPMDTRPGVGYPWAVEIRRLINERTR